MKRTIEEHVVGDHWQKRDIFTCDECGAEVWNYGDNPVEWLFSVDGDHLCWKCMAKLFADVKRVE